MISNREREKKHYKFISFSFYFLFSCIICLIIGFNTCFMYDESNLIACKEYISIFFCIFLFCATFFLSYNFSIYCEWKKVHTGISISNITQQKMKVKNCNNHFTSFFVLRKSFFFFIFCNKVFEWKLRLSLGKKVHRT